MNWDNGFVTIYFYSKTKITEANRADIEANDWYDPLLEYDELDGRYINVPVWVDASSVRYNAVAYTYIPLDSEILGLSATRLPIDGRVPIFRVGGIGIVSSSKAQELPSAIAGTTYDLNDQRISWAELEDANGTKVAFDLYTVDYDYGRVTLGGDFVLGNLVAPLTVKYRYQDMGLIRDVQINGQLTFTKPLTHNYDAVDTIVGSALVIGDMQARYTRKFVQGTWNGAWADGPTGATIPANYNDALYPFWSPIRVLFRSAGIFSLPVQLIFAVLVNIQAKLVSVTSMRIMRRSTQSLVFHTSLSRKKAGVQGGQMVTSYVLIPWLQISRSG